MTMRTEFVEIATKVRNWGRWGDDDERGTLNLIDDAARRAAVACVRDGRVFPLAIPLSGDGPQTGAVAGRVNPELRRTSVNQPIAEGSAALASDDSVTMPLQAATHWDALAHVSYDGVIWNGFPSSSVTVEAGATRCGIDKVGPLLGRGVLLDVARALGEDRVESGHALTPDDLDAAADVGDVRVEPGDIVLIRTGQIQHLAADPPDRWAYLFPSPGPSLATVSWFREHDVAAVATDTMTFEVYPWEYDDLVMPVHLLHMVEIGMLQGQNWNLEQLAVDCASDGRYSFLLEATPEPFVGGLGSPVAPVAVK